MSEIIAKLIDLIMPIINGKTALGIRMKTKSQLFIWVFILFILTVTFIMGFFFAWSRARAWLGLPILPSIWLGTTEEFFSGIVIAGFLLFIAACFILNASFRPDDMDSEAFDTRSRKILRKMFLFLGVVLSIDLVYVWFRWDLYQKLTVLYDRIQSFQCPW